MSSSRAGIWVRALRGLGRDRHDVSSRSGRTGTLGYIRSVEHRTSAIDNPVDAATHIVGNIERTVRTNG
jgi:hypothetical protein